METRTKDIKAAPVKGAVLVSKNFTYDVYKGQPVVKQAEPEPVKASKKKEATDDK